ncbi:MAG: DUF3168 domain-containing protein [Alphaproteobacteria bacterium]|nr:MAG: DUF3168 domain-containing protein [Alphaproteobacteria bacterium]
MSADSAWDVQTAIYSRLSGTSALTALLAAGAAGVCDHVPEGMAFPYVVLSTLQAQPGDTQQTHGYDITLSIASYSRGEGMKELRGIMAAIYDTLHDASFSVPNQTLILCRQLSSETQLEQDGVTRAGLQRFRIITEPV